MNSHNNLQDALIRAALAIHERAYAPYSGFKVGAAVLTGSNDIFTGCNVENSSYGLSVCAERNAISRAVSEGHCDISAIAIYASTTDVTMPCGACRQVLAEFNPEMEVILMNLDHSITRLKLSEIFPRPFLFERGDIE